MKSKNGFKFSARKRPSGNYVGILELYDEGRKCWALPTGILRLSRADAVEDARKLAEDYYPGACLNMCQSK